MNTKKMIKYKKEFHGQIKTYTMSIVDEDGVYYTITCLGDKGEDMGYATCVRKSDSFWLNKIETYEGFGHQGVGSAVIDIVEYLAMQNRRKTVDGKFYPFNNSYAKPFYLSHGYVIPNQKGGWDDYDETWHMYKNIDFKKIKKDVESNIEVVEEIQEEME